MSEYRMDASEFNEKIMKGYFRKIYPVIARQIVDRALLKRIGIEGEVEHGEAGTWIVFSKPEVQS